MDDLLDRAIAHPSVAEREARAILARSHDAMEASYAHQCLGIVLRDRGEMTPALRHLRTAVRSAESLRSAAREADVRATFGAALVVAGRQGEALRQLELAAREAHLLPDHLKSKILMRRAGSLMILGRYQEAAPVARDALTAFQAAGDEVWAARTRIWIAIAEMSGGNLSAATQEAELAETAFKKAGASVERLSALELLARVSAARGDLAAALALFGYLEEAASHEGLALRSRYPTVEAHAEAYVAAGLAADAVRLLGGVRLADLSAQQRAECHLLLALATLAAGDPDAGGEHAARARAMFRRQGRSWLELRARLTAVRAGARGARLAEAVEVARALHDERADEAPVALTLAGRLSKGEERGELWRQAASYRTHPNALVRASAWLARALEREEAGDRGGALRACRAGLDAIDEQRRLLGSTELRAQATTHGRELTEVALRAAATEPRRLLGWTERTRATTLAQPRMTSDVATIPESLAALRDNGRQLAEARAAGEPTERLERERLRLERAVRAESHTVSATGTNPDRAASVEEVVAGVGEGCLVEMVEVDGLLHVLVVHDGKVRRRVAGPAAEAAALLDPVAMLLRRSARGRPAATDQLGRRLQAAILGDAVRLIPDGPVVLAPTTRLHGLPWAVLPALADRPFSVVPSAGQWLRARAVSRPQERRTVLVCGPGLESGGAEVPLLAQAHPDADLLTYKQATLDAVLAGLDGADLVHLAAHGHFRADSPLFSSLDLADGPLTVHDIERIGRAPYRVVLSACESGVLAPVGAQELLGLAAALFGLGTAGLVCSVAEVNDDATAQLMVGLHAALAEGKDPATALWEVRRDASDPTASATAAAFLALGV